MKNLPKEIPIFPLPNFIIFPNSIVPLNIFEKKYIEMINDCMKGNRIFGVIQPKDNKTNKPGLYQIGCAGKITSFNETDDGRYLIVVSGLSRFRILNENETNKLYRKVSVDFKEFSNDFKSEITESIDEDDFNNILNDFKILFDRQGYLINWNEFQKNDFAQTINTLSMASPFSTEEKQILLESKSLEQRKNKLNQILSLYLSDRFKNKTIQ